MAELSAPATACVRLCAAKTFLQLVAIEIIIPQNYEAAKQMGIQVEEM